MRCALGLRPAFVLALVPMTLALQDDGYTPPPQPPTLQGMATFTNGVGVALEITVDFEEPPQSLIKAVVYAGQSQGIPTSGNPPALATKIYEAPYQGSMFWVLSATHSLPSLNVNGPSYWVWVELVYGNARGAAFGDSYSTTWAPPLADSILPMPAVGMFQLATMIDFGQRGGMIVSVEKLGGSVDGYTIDKIDVYADSGLSPKIPSAIDATKFSFSIAADQQVGHKYVDYNDDDSVVWVLADVSLVSQTQAVAGASPPAATHRKLYRTVVTGRKLDVAERMVDLNANGPPPTR